MFPCCSSSLWSSPGERARLASLGSPIPCSRTSSDPLAHLATLADLAARKPDQFHVQFVLDKPPSGWKGPTGYVNSEVVKEAFKKFNTTPEGNVKIFVCALCPRP